MEVPTGLCHLRGGRPTHGASHVSEETNDLAPVRRIAVSEQPCKWACLLKNSLAREGSADESVNGIVSGKGSLADLVGGATRARGKGKAARAKRLRRLRHTGSGLFSTIEVGLQLPVLYLFMICSRLLSLAELSQRMGGRRWSPNPLRRFLPNFRLKLVGTRGTYSQMPARESSR